MNNMEASASAKNLGNGEPETGELCFDHNRVILKGDKESSDYINASYIDNFKQPKAYIGVLYWKLEERATLYCGKLNVETIKVRHLHPNFEITTLLITHEDQGSLLVDHFLYKNWSNIDSVPPGADFLDLVNMVRTDNKYVQKLSNGCKSPVIVHCSDGLNRSIVFCAIDIAITKDQKVVDVSIFSIVTQLRKQRYNCLDQHKTEGLCSEDRHAVLSKEKKSQDLNYIDASYIDDFEQPRAYIVTKTPDSEAAIHNFWKMIWKEKTDIIVMLNKPDQNEKGLIYWNLEIGSTFCCGKLKVETIIVQPEYHSFEQTKLLLTDENGDFLFVDHFLFTSWPRINFLPPSNKFYELISMIRLYNRYAVTNKLPNGYKSPMVVHCSDGLSRSRVFFDVNLSISRTQKTNDVNFSLIKTETRTQNF
ncbi:hypothetical protein G9C98_000660 [Cotesia typhae]|uniref:Protein tyrosine phosphatase n=1 Tax=Cotesia typhae TaxID=2053667 RepID=A0A8J5UTM5_9HYME|nr:hypothetical protein G9C98_000660 [Cotesia typhae]